MGEGGAGRGREEAQEGQRRRRIGKRAGVKRGFRCAGPATLGVGRVTLTTMVSSAGPLVPESTEARVPRLLH